jgi:hypothetical protein
MYGHCNLLMKFIRRPNTDYPRVVWHNMHKLTSQQYSVDAMTDNEVDDTALFSLTENDIMAMFTGKVGAARKLIVLLEKVRHPSSSTVSFV